MAIVIATRGPKIGECNVCGDYGSLTEDHTPPKGCLKPTQVEMHHITRLLSDETKPSKGRISQNGVKYRTLCHRCNNTLLGTKYDPSFIAFVNGVGKLLTSSLHLPNSIAVRGKPQAIMRSLLGHISAQGVDRYKKGPLTEAIRDFFLDTTRPLPASLRIFYWAYPYRPHVMARDAAYLDIPSGKTFAIWMLKFLPIAFLVAWDETIGLDYPIHSFEPWRDCAFDLEVDLPVNLRSIPPEYWPEAPSGHSVLAYGKEAMFVKGLSRHSTKDS